MWISLGKHALSCLLILNHARDTQAFVPRHSPTRHSHSPLLLSNSRDSNVPSLLEEWASNHRIVTSDSVTIFSNDGDDYGMALTKSCKKYDSLLVVPKDLVLDSEYIRREWYEYLEAPLDYIRDWGLHESGLNFVLFVKLLVEHSLQKQSRFEPWIASLPTEFDTGVCMDDIEIGCLPPFALALANFEKQQLDIFRKALGMIVADGKERIEGGKEALLYHDIDDELTMWAFNVITTRCWRYQQDDDDEDMIRPIAVPLGDMFNHREPPNVMVKDADSFDAVEFILSEDVEVEDGSSSPLYLSYGLTNPHRFLAVFGFVDESMPEVFSQLLFTNPDDDLVHLGCNDRSKMVYRTADGGISTTVWDCILHTLLAQIPSEQEEFYRAHVEGDGKKKMQFHQKYALEECLTLRNHVEGTKKEFGALVEKIDAMAKNGAYEYHPRLRMIRRHNSFLYETFDKVLQGINARAKTETERRRG